MLRRPLQLVLQHTRPIYALASSSPSKQKQGTLDSFLGTTMAPKKRSAAASTSAAASASTSSSKKRKTGGGKAVKNDNEEEEKERSPTPEPQDEDTPWQLFEAARTALGQTKAPSQSKEGVIVYWARNKDLRLSDNRALSLASAHAEGSGLPLVAMHILSPSDYKAHRRSPRRIDFQLRQLKLMREDFAKLDVPLYVWTSETRKDIPNKVVKLMEDWKAVGLYGNVEYEVDELRRDTAIIDSVLAARKEDKGRGWAGKVEFTKDFVICGPGEILTLQNKPYAVYSPFYRNWVKHVTGSLLTYLEDYGYPTANAGSARSHPILKPLFEVEVPFSVPGFELEEEDKVEMARLWPVGEETANKVLDRFLKTKIREGAFADPPLAREDEEEVELSKAKVGVYTTERNRPDMDGTSHISPYLAAGLISPRACLRATTALTNRRLRTERENGVGMWVGELAWRDFYQQVLAAFPRVSMNKTYLVKFEKVVWEDPGENWEKWTEGLTGFPIVDAGMRALKKQGYMHNRVRMIVAMFLTKDLMIDWKMGEAYFMEQLIDGDLGANNGGWQWSASTGTDPQPYFRIFHPVSQSEKSDQTGDYIRYWVPELKNLKGKALHDPSSVLSDAELNKIGYPRACVDHATARKRALARYKTPGSSANE